MKKYFFFIAFICISASINAQAKQAITHESMWLMKRAGAPELSPDGKWVIFSVQEPAYDEKEIMNDLWITSPDGSSKPRRLTGNKAPETSYKWSPDGAYIAFTAKRNDDETAQIYLLNMKDGGEAQRFTNLSTGAAAPQWSPDGKMILFTSRVYPGAFTDSANKKMEEEKKKQKYKARVYTSFPIRYWDQWLDEKQTHAFVQSIDSSAARDLFADISLTTGEGFNFQGNMCWSADSKEIIFCATAEYNTAAYGDVVTNLYSLSLKGGDAVQLTKEDTSYTLPVFSKDGKYLFAIGSAEKNYRVYNLGRLTRFDWPSMQHKTILAESLDRPVNSYTIAKENIYLSIEDEGHDRLYRLPLNSQKPEIIITDKAGCYNTPAVSNDEQVIIASYEDATMPPELVRIDNNRPLFITAFNKDKLALLDLSRAEEFWFTGTRNKKIHNMLIKPAGFNPEKKYPLFVVIHGGPANAWKDNWSYRWNYQLLAQPGYILVLTNYTGSTSFGEKFSRDIQFDPFKGPADEINEAADFAIKSFAFIDGSRQAAGGASYGGHLTNWLEATTSHYKCLICHAGLVNSETQWGTSDVIYGREVMNGGVPWTQNKTWREQNPIRYADKFTTPILVTVGEQDFRVPLNNSLENWSALQRMKVPSKLIVFPEENHWILKAEDSRFFYQQLQEWLAKYLK